MNKLNVAILGATGAVGQRFIQLLDQHPQFQVSEVVASERSAGKQYKDAVNWKLPTPLPTSIADLTVKQITDKLTSKVLFSGLDASIAGEAEDRFRSEGYIVISNSKNHRMDDDVPLIVPEINPSHLDLVLQQKKKFGGAIVTNPNCSTIGLVMGLAPLMQFGIEKVMVTTMQAISGAGYPGVPSFDILDNIVPTIGGEEDKIESEPKKIFGKLSGDSIEFAPFPISAMVNRVPAIDGHMEAVSIKFSKSVSKEDLEYAFQNFSAEPQDFQCHFAPNPAIIYFNRPDRPQTRLDRDLGKGMAVSVGNLRPCSIFDWKFTVLSHNTIRGAAGGTILIAELMLAKGLL